MATNIPSREYNDYLAAVKSANDFRDRQMMLSIRKELYEKYSSENDDVKWLVNQFKLHLD